MQWWFGSIGAIVIILIIFLLKKWTRLREFKIKTLDISVIPLWIILHYTMGYRFGVSWVLWFIIVWCLVGATLSLFLLQKKWHWRSFWYKFWEWSGLLGGLLLFIVTIVGFTTH
ncbi:DUF3397 family protein [Leuconostoc rapi]|uniref:DUF3397 family protein n=1 Tax=Leuconostoc rapi TaxID=1406906 RepID=UPI00195942DA|nr:DUF3397 family protein [Leuconostoc rapi]MBM7434802.1 membrane protein YdbS with pleckstrin-like domain [Leuconostoc rapi]